MKRLLPIAILCFATACATDDGPGETPNNENNLNNVNNTNNVNNMEELSIVTLTPSTGNINGGTSVSISGTGFATGMTITVGGADATDVVVVTSRAANFVTPAGMIGPADVTVTLDGNSVTETGGFTYIDSADPSIGFCQLQAQSPASATVGEASDALFAIVFSDGLTNMAGQGEFIEGELGWGSGANFDGYTFVPMTYNEDKDGLNPGDLSNDEYGASLTIPSAGEFWYVARFRTQQRADEWVYCDLDGSENGTTEDQIGVITVAEPVLPTVGFCELFAQSPVAATTGEASPTISAQVYVDGITNGAGAGSGIEGELGYGSTTDAVDQYTFQAMTYEGDLDGLGTLDNDQYGATFTVGTAGEYRYAARFRVGANGDWTYCDLDASDNDGTNNPGTLNVSDPAVPEISFCQTETAVSTGITNMASNEITAVVFAAGITAGAGQGANIDAEIVWGDSAADPSTWTDTVTAAYKEDTDGLNAGDLANDRYAATITATTAGNYGYAMRVRLNGGTWMLCDTDGNGGGAAFEPTKVGALTVTDAVVNLPDECNVQFPEINSKMLVGESMSVFGRVIESGSTGSGAAVTDLSGELLVGPQGADPTSNIGAFTVIASTVRASVDVINPLPMQDEYEATFTPTAAGDYIFLYRFTVDGGANWSYCDLDGTGATSNFQPDRVGVVSVYDSATNPELVDYCRVFQTNLSVLSTDSSPLVTVETFEAGLTDSAGATADITAEVGYGAVGANPAVTGAYTWNPTTMPYKGVGPSAPNNWEYESGIYPDAAKPAVGSYGVAVRVRLTSTSAWVYCDTDNTTMDFFRDRVTSLTVN